MLQASWNVLATIWPKEFDIEEYLNPPFELFEEGI